ncbi:SEL1-like repeat protein, partial [Acidovorax sp.]|uniref:SEL1-like repeat protein n=1 Tax=Acidovorax sp. TaxID=1872122 RepID=UPI0025C0FFB2
HRKAQLDYGLMRIFGIGVERDREDGIHWLKRAAKDPATLEQLKERIALLCAEHPLVVGPEACAQWALVTARN